MVSFENPEDMWKYAREWVMQHRKDEYETALASFIAASQKPIEEHSFLKEYVWVVHVSGFKASIISGKFQRLLQAHKIEDEHGNYQPITQDTIFCSQDHFREVYSVWKNYHKAKAVQNIRRLIWDQGWPSFRDEFLADRNPEQIGKLPFMGQALRYHMARNLGNLDAVKPDLHLNRLAAKYGFASAQVMCERLSSDRPGITDLALFFCAIDCGTL